MICLANFHSLRMWRAIASGLAMVSPFVLFAPVQGSVQSEAPPSTRTPITAEPGPVFYFTTLAGTASAGTADGIGSAARFNRPEGLTIDSRGNLFVADSGNSAVRQITPQGVVTTVAGKPGDARVVDGSLASARFQSPNRVAADRSGALYVAEYSIVRRIGVDGAVTTIAGAEPLPDEPSRDGTGAEARFSSIGGIAVDPAGVIYASDTEARTIRRITPAGVVTTFAGSAGVRGSADGTGADARFSYPLNLAADAAGTLWVPDASNYTLRRITSAGAVTTFAGRTGVAGTADGLGAAAEFKAPTAVATDLAGNFYVADASRIRAITPAGAVTTLAGGEQGSADGTGAAAAFRAPEGIAVDQAGNVFVSDRGNNAIRKITPAGVVTTLAGLRPDQATGSADGVGAAARFNQPRDIAVTAEGVCYVADTANHVIRRIAADGTVTTFAGSPGQSGYVDGTGAAARFDSPGGLALDRAGNLYVIDSRATIRKITPAGVVTTLAGSGQVGLPTNGQGSAAVFWHLTAIAVAPDGAIWVAESRGYPPNYSGYWWARLRKVTPDGTVTGEQMLGTDAWPHTFWSGLAFAPDGTLYACDGTYYRLVKVTAGKTEAHDLNSAGFSPYDVAVTPNGEVYLTEGYASRAAIGRFNSDGTVKLVGGSLAWTAAGHRDGVGSEALFNGVAGLATDAKGALYVACTDNTIRKGVVASAPTVTTQPQNQTVTAGAGATFTVSAAATPEPAYQWYFNGTAITGATTSSFTVSSASSTSAGNYHVVVANEVGSATSATAMLTVSTPPSGGGSTGGSPSGGGGGGGAPSDFFLAACTALALARWWQRKGARHTDCTRSASPMAGCPRGFAIEGMTPFLRALFLGFVSAVPVAAFAQGTVVQAATTTQTNLVPPPTVVSTAVADLPAYQFTTLAGTASGGAQDGTGSAARFFRPRSLTIDSGGNLYVADSGNNSIRKITPAGVVTTVAGKPGDAHAVDGPLAAARFRSASQVAIDPTGVLYVGDSVAIRRIGLDGAVTTLAGFQGDGYPAPSSTDGTGTAARFNGISGLTLAPSGVLYASDSGGSSIRQITAQGVVTTVAGQGKPGASDGTGAAAGFYGPGHLATDAAGNIYVPDAGNSTIRKIAPGGVVTTFAGRARAAGAADGIGTNASFHEPVAVAVDLAGNVFVSDSANQAIRMITPGGAVTTIAGQPPLDVNNGSLQGTPGSSDGVGRAATFRYPAALVTDAAGNVYVADTGNNTVRKITPAGAVTTLAGLPPEQAIGATDGRGAAARFNRPAGVAVASDGSCYVADTGNHIIRRIARDGTVTTLAGSAGQPGNADGTGTAARFNTPVALAVDAAGLLYVVDQNNALVRTVTPAGVVSTPAWTGQSGLSPNFNTDVQAIAIDRASGAIFVGQGKAISVIKNGAVERTMFLSPPAPNSDPIVTGLAVDAAGNCYAADRVNRNIWKIDAAGNATALIDHRLTTFNPLSLAFDPAGRLFMTEELGRIGRLESDGGVTIVGGALNVGTHRDGTGTDALFGAPAGIAIAADGTLFISSVGAEDNTIRAGSAGSFPIVTTQPQSQTVSAGGTVTFTVVASGLPAPTYQWYFNEAAVSGATSASFTISSVSAADAGSYHVVVTNALGSATSAKATLTVTASGNTGGSGASPATGGGGTPPAGGGSGGASPVTGGGGGGGAPSDFFLAACGALALARAWQRRHALRHASSFEPSGPGRQKSAV